MNIEDTPAPERGTPTDRRPLGFWLRLVDRRLNQAFAAALHEDGVGRREWMLLNLLAGDVDDEHLARLARFADRLAERGGKHGGKLMRGLAERGWIIPTGGGWALTDEGRAARDSLKLRVDAIRERITSALSPEEYERMVASLEAVARALGWDGQEQTPWGGKFGRGRDFGPGLGLAPEFRLGLGFGPKFGFEPECGRTGRHGFPRAFDRPTGNAHRGFAPGSGPRGGMGPADDLGPRTERAYERGFEAGFAAASHPRTSDAS